MRHAELLGRLVLELEDPQWNFRTLPGLSKALGISQVELEGLLEDHARLIRWMPACDENGEQLFIGSFRRATWRERLIRLRAHIAHEDMLFTRPA
jgi:hypothetical protein